jgi:[ribosomal protein S5]-alanine N-acetyltransferase
MPENNKPLTDGMVTLRELLDTDLPNMANYANNIKVAMNVRDGFPHPYTLEDAIHFKNMADQKVHGFILAIEYEGQYTGNIGLSPGMDVYRKSAEIGYFIGEPFWNKGITTRAVKLMTVWGFENLDIIRIHTGVFDYNIASQRVLEKCGYQKEGVFRKSVFKFGRICDEIRYAMLKEEQRGSI